jgi:hypothetical protein
VESLIRSIETDMTWQVPGGRTVALSATSKHSLTLEMQALFD